MSVADRGQTLLSVSFDSTLISWRGPAPFVFAPVPAEHSDAIRHAARVASYGWGVVPVEARIGNYAFRTSLFPRDGGYLLPIKRAAQTATGIGPGDVVHAELSVVMPLS